MTDISSVFTALGQVTTFIFGFFAQALDVLTSNPLLFVAILIPFAGSFILFAYKIIKRFRG